MRLETPSGPLTLLNEPTYSFGSADNARSYPFVFLLDHEHAPTSVHGVLLGEQPVVVYGDSGGCSGIHQHSLAIHNGATYLAVGRHVVKFVTHPFTMHWSLKVDDATCFGVYVSPERNALFSHGELEICRFSEEGILLWSASGADIFSEGFSLEPGWVEAIDFNKRAYRFNYEDGQLRV